MSEDGKRIKRLQFDFSPGAFERLEALKGMIGAKKRAEVVRCGLRLLEWHLTQVAKKNRIVIETEEGRSFEVKLAFGSTEGTWSEVDGD